MESQITYKYNLSFTFTTKDKCIIFYLSMIWDLKMESKAGKAGMLLEKL